MPQIKNRTLKIVIWTLIAIVVIFILDLLVPWNRNKTILDASEAFFRYEFAKQKRPDDYTFFIKIKDKDPPRQLLARLRNHSPRVRKGSDAQYDIHGVRNGVVFFIHSYKWSGNFLVVINGGLYVGPLGLETGDYTLVKIFSKWLVVSYSSGVWA